MHKRTLYLNILDFQNEFVSDVSYNMVLGDGSFIDDDYETNRNFTKKGLTDC